LGGGPWGGAAPGGAPPPPTRLCSFGGCGNKHKARGYCETHYSQRYKRGQNLTRAQQRLTGVTTAERLELRTDKSGECWLWTGAQDRDGYGLIHTDEGTRGAHRVAFTLAGGVIPEGFHVDHICHTRNCVRPDHLQAVTPAENVENRRMQRNNTSGAIGVEPRRGRFRARVGHRGRTNNVGTFDTAEEAAEVAKSVRIQLHTNNLLDRSA